MDRTLRDLLRKSSLAGQWDHRGPVFWCAQVEEQKRRAEADKLAAITALEQRSREFMREKEEKRRLEARIANMQSQLLIGGNKLEDTPVFRSAPLASSLPLSCHPLSLQETDNTCTCLLCASESVDNLLQC